MVWYLEHQVKGRTSGAQESIRNNTRVNPTKSLWGGGQLPQSRYYNNRSSGWVCWPRHPLYRLSRDQYYSSWEMFQPSYLPEIQIWLVSGYSRLIESRKKNESLQHKSTRWRCEILGEWTTIASSKTWAGSATNMWTRCPRQAWPCSSLIIKHYRVQVGNHHRGYRSPCIRYTLKKELLLLEQINQWLGVLGTHMEWRLQVSKPQNTSHVCMTDLGWFQRKQN